MGRGRGQEPVLVRLKLRASFIEKGRGTIGRNAQRMAGQKVEGSLTAWRRAGGIRKALGRESKKLVEILKRRGDYE